MSNDNMGRDLTPFDFEGKPVRIVQIEGEPHFVGRDVADHLGYADANNAMKQHCRGVVKRHPITDALGRAQEVRVLSEPDLLRLIVGSRLPSAERFERWVFEEVLPTIRKTGGYGAADPMAALNDPASLRGLLLQNVEKVIALEGQVAEMAPQVQALERIAIADGSLCVTDAAKTLQIRPKNLFQFLRSNGWIYRRPGTDTDIAYQSKLTTGVLEHKTETVHRNDGSEKVRTQVRITPKGLTVLGKLLPPAAEAA